MLANLNRFLQTKIITGEFQITKEFSGEKDIKKKAINKICVLLKSTDYNFEPNNVFSHRIRHHCRHRS